MTLTTGFCYDWIGRFTPEFIPSQAAESSSTEFVTIDGGKIEETASQ